MDDWKTTFLLGMPIFRFYFRERKLGNGLSATLIPEYSLHKPYFLGGEGIGGIHIENSENFF